MGLTATPERGDFCVSHIGGQVGLGIRVGQWLNGTGRCPYEHASVFVGLVDGSPALGWFVEAEPGGARMAAYPMDRDAVWSSGSVRLSEPQRAAIVAAALGYIGTGYSAADYAALIAHRLHVPAPHLRAYIESSGHMICSQLVDQCYQDAGVQLFTDGRWPGYVTPGDLWRLVR